MSDKKWRVEPFDREDFGHKRHLWSIWADDKLIGQIIDEADAHSVVDAHNGQGEPVRWEARTHSSAGWSHWFLIPPSYRRMYEDSKYSEVRPIYAPPVSPAIAVIERMREALQRISQATPINTNSRTADAMRSWCKAVADSALEDADAILAELKGAQG